MTKEQIQQNIKSIVLSERAFGIEVYAYISENESRSLLRVVLTEKLKNNLSIILREAIKNGILNGEAVFDTSDNIADNRKVFYEVMQDDSYHPFTMLEHISPEIKRYTDKYRKSLVGFFFRININDSFFWAYQQIYSMARLDRSKHVYAILTGATYDDIDKDILQIDSRTDIIILENCILTQKIDLLQKQFGFETYIREGAKQTIQLIDGLDIVSGLDKFFAYGDKEKLTNAKKLLKAKNSPVLKMEKNTLLANIKKHSRYSKLFTIENEHIVVASQKDAAAFIKMINDDYVRSELTGQEYDSSTKSMLAPLDAAQ